MSWRVKARGPPHWQGGRRCSNTVVVVTYTVPGIVVVYTHLMGRCPGRPVKTRVLGGAFCFCVVLVLFIFSFLFFFLMPVASPSGRHDLVAYPSCLRLKVFFFPSLVFVCYSYYFSGYSFSFFFSFFFSSFFFVFRFFALLRCIFCACRIQYDGMALHCLLPFLHYDVPGSTCVVVL